MGGAAYVRTLLLLIKTPLEIAINRLWSCMIYFHVANSTGESLSSILTGLGSLLTVLFCLFAVCCVFLYTLAM